MSIRASFVRPGRRFEVTFTTARPDGRERESPCAYTPAAASKRAEEAAPGGKSKNKYTTLLRPQAVLIALVQSIHVFVSAWVGECAPLRREKARVL